MQRTRRDRAFVVSESASAADTGRSLDSSRRVSATATAQRIEREDSRSLRSANVPSHDDRFGPSL